jgi:succinoglycan biosynthesis protein ExoM
MRKMDVSPPFRVAICACTYRRPKLLRDLLEGIGRLAFQKHETEPEIHVIIVDNDVDESAKEIVESMRSNYRWPLHYNVETERNISRARNRALETAAKVAASLIAMVDDDEVPDAFWLDEALTTLSRASGDIVYGPVIPIYAENPAPWLTEGKFFLRKRWPTGTALNYAYTHNVIVKASVASQSGGFDPFWGLKGGEDRDFFFRLCKTGHKVIYCDEAIVREFVPASRMCWKWIMQRSFRTGVTDGLLEQRHRIRPRIVTMGRGLYLISTSLLAFPLVWAAVNKGSALRLMSRAVFGGGLIAGSFAFHYEEYR